MLSALKTFHKIKQPNKMEHIPLITLNNMMKENTRDMMKLKYLYRKCHLHLPIGDSYECIIVWYNTIIW